MTDNGAGGAEPRALPDFLVVVMDCVRASDFPGGGPNAVRMPFVENLRPQSVVFPHAASVAPWTLPSHASIFTGLYPWEHGCHGRGTLRLDPRYERVSQVLRTTGYASASFSGNPIISPHYGLTDGFDLAEWGEWWEQVNRVRSTPSQTHVRTSGDTGPEIPDLSFRVRAQRIMKIMLARVPAVLATGNAVARRTLAPRDDEVGSVNRWIEPELRRWLSGQPKDRPTFCFVNLIDAHEPYLLDPRDASSLRDWWSYMRIPQDPLALLVGPKPPAQADLDRLHTLYREAIAGIDRRLTRIVQIYKDSGRWPGTLAIFTSDHGQAFGEHGMVWHGVRTDEEMLRVPLMVRFPHDEFGGRSARGWATPMDVPATLLDLAGVPRRIGSGVSLRSLVDAERPTAILAAGDGTEWNAPLMARLSPQRKLELNLFTIAACQGSTKVVVDATTGAVRGYDLTGTPPTELDQRRLDSPEVGDLIFEARHAADALLRAPESAGSDTVDERLRSWGYG